jgi:hypothetical protein
MTTYCDPCAEVRGWPGPGWLKSAGRCEICGEQRLVNNVTEPLDIRTALRRLDGTDATAVLLMTGFSAEELDDLGGLPEEGSNR